jgi:DNA-binding MarR family transcriptional regulator
MSLRDANDPDYCPDYFERRRLIYGSSIDEPSRLAVLLALNTHIGPSGQLFPSIELIAKETRFSPATVKRSFRDLIAEGFVERVRQRSNHYRIRFDQLGESLRKRITVIPFPGSPRSQDQLTMIHDGAHVEPLTDKGTEKEQCERKSQNGHAQRPGFITAEAGKYRHLSSHRRR